MSADPSLRNKLLPVRLTERELVDIDARARKLGWTRSRWVRTTLLSGSPPVPETDAELRGLIAELLRLRFQLKQVGNNLNQLVRLIHSRQVHTTQGSEQMLERLTESVRAVTEQLDDLRRLLHRRRGEP